MKVGATDRWHPTSPPCWSLSPEARHGNNRERGAGEERQPHSQGGLPANSASQGLNALTGVFLSGAAASLDNVLEVTGDRRNAVAELDECSISLALSFLR